MEPTCIISEPWKLFFDVFGLIASAFALCFSVLYFFHPRFLITLYLSDHQKSKKEEMVYGERLNIRIKNGNIIRKSIVEIKCEVTAMHCDNIENKMVKTLVLAKNEIILLKKIDDNYTFYTKNNWDEDKIDYKDNFFEIIRVRILAQNFLGMKKVAEGFFKISTLMKNDQPDGENIGNYSKMPCP